MENFEEKLRDLEEKFNEKFKEMRDEISELKYNIRRLQSHTDYPPDSY